MQAEIQKEKERFLATQSPATVIYACTIYVKRDVKCDEIGGNEEEKEG